MLGRQQIAGIQNALSELFKNAHDAYADNVTVDYFEDFGGEGQGFLIVRDDGFGMTEADFVGKWLVLGTESKTETSEPPYRPQDKGERPITGEKGIGRLAIALLGNQTIILTRAEREDGLHDLVAALVHWGLFEISGLDLDEIEIPITMATKGRLPTADQLAGLRSELVICARRLASIHPHHPMDRIIEEIESFQPDLDNLYGFLAAQQGPDLRLDGSATGTHFLIAPSNPVIRMEMEAEQKNDDYSFRKHLLGFADEVFQGDEPARIKASFRRWEHARLVPEELLDPNTFFSRRELIEETDHLLTGRVDEFGQFSGSLRVYSEAYDNLVVPWSANRGRQTRCGPFDVTFGYVMGFAKESTLPPEKYNAINEKLNHVGGMYVYRDGIRILPYGDYSFDWLDVEKRRNKGAGYYFFSFRRMFGAVLLTRGENYDLKEKAGREGFQQNEAYRELRDIVINLLLYLAAEFFRKDGTNAELFEITQLEMRKRSEALERQQKRSNSKRKKFAVGLAAFSGDIQAGLPVSEVTSLRKLTRARMDAASTIADQDKAAAALIRAEQEAIGSLVRLREKYTRKRPTGVALGRELQRDWEGYVDARANLESTIFAPFEQEVSQTLGAVAEQARVYVDQRKRLEERIKTLATERRKELAEASRQANATASDTRQTVFKITERARLALDETIRSIQADLNRTDLLGLGPERIEAMRRRWEEQLTEIEARHRDALMAARDMLASLAENLKSSDGEEPAQVMQAMEERMLALEEQADEDFEMVQLGLAVAIINHEFAASIKRVRKSLQELGQISRRSEGLKPLYESIRSNFEHLDGHLNLFTPLQRRLHRNAQDISGLSIRNYCVELFANRLERHSIELIASERFLGSSVRCFPSTLYPAVINVVDNALHWLKDVRDGRRVFLDADAGGIYISNNGPSIEARDFQRIFERSFSRKVGGRGLGLFISARALEAEAMSLTVLDPPLPGNMVTFKIGTTMIGVFD
ncbi:ATP-binding protein [Mesorhizobium sp. M0482]|uniref:ATP-binding protein n=1 Tax=Mesorhizobium sp. M0482 TaxID=2956948 RepID=UPI0033355A60